MSYLYRTKLKSGASGWVLWACVMGCMLVVELPAEAQLRRFQTPIAFQASPAVVWPAERPTLLRPGEYVFAIRVTVTRGADRPENRALFTAGAVKFVSDAGVIHYSSLTSFVNPPLEFPCEGSRYLMANASVTCDVAFAVPQDVVTGVLELSVPGYYADPVRIRIR
jgi:hypothetical protein